MTKTVFKIILLIIVFILILPACKIDKLDLIRTISFMPTNILFDNTISNASETVIINNNNNFQGNQEITPIIKSTYTSFPTLSSLDQKVEFDKYIHDNGKCSLPCWWGIAVGETDWTFATQELNSLFEDQIAETSNIIIQGKQYIQDVNSYFYHEGNYDIYTVIHGFHGSVIYLYVMSTMTNIFNIPMFVSAMGSPNHIYLATFSQVEGYPIDEQYLPFNLVLQYDEENVVIWYEINAQNDGKTITSCFNEGNRFNIWIWSEEYGNLSIEHDALDTAGGGYEGSKQLKNLEDVTDLSIESFVEMFTNNPNACISTPAENW